MKEHQKTFEVHRLTVAFGDEHETFGAIENFCARAGFWPLSIMLEYIYDIETMKTVLFWKVKCVSPRPSKQEIEALFQAYSSPSMGLKHLTVAEPKPPKDKE
jgi:hypothetical protein